MPVERFNPQGLAPPPSKVYSHVVKAANTVYVTGQVARNVDGNTVGKGDFTAQLNQVFDNLQACLQSVGGTLKNLVKINVYLTRRDDLSTYRSICSQRLADNLPASTLVFISGLSDPEFLVEIEGIAVLP